MDVSFGSVSVLSSHKNSGAKLENGVIPLGTIIDTIFEAVAVPEEYHDTINLSHNPLKLSIIGKPCSGKTTLAKEISTKYGLEIISVNDLVESAIAQALTIGKYSADSVVQEKDDSSLELSRIGTKVQLSPPMKSRFKWHFWREFHLMTKFSLI